MGEAVCVCGGELKFHEARSATNIYNPVSLCRKICSCSYTLRLIVLRLHLSDIVSYIEFGP